MRQKPIEKREREKKENLSRTANDDVHSYSSNFSQGKALAKDGLARCSTLP